MHNYFGNPLTILACRADVHSLHSSQLGSICNLCQIKGTENIAKYENYNYFTCKCCCTQSAHTNSKHPQIQIHAYIYLKPNDAQVNWPEKRPKCFWTTVGQKLWEFNVSGHFRSLNLLF